jgi:hypothetical protein
LLGKPERRRPLGRPSSKRGRMDLIEVGWDDVDWLRIGTGGGLL